MFDVGKELCDALMRHQVRDEGSPDFGAISCPCCRCAHARTGEATFPFCYFYTATKQEKYLQSALELSRWLARTQNDDGSWGDGISESRECATVSLTDALCHAHRLVYSQLTAEDKASLEGMLRHAAQYIYQTASLQWAESEAVGINCFALSCPALHLGSIITGEVRYADRARENALLAISRINEEGFLVGEAPSGGKRSLSGVDVALNLEVGLGALAIYSSLSGNREVREAVLSALRAHMSFITPFGSIDDSWGTRLKEWTVLGNANGYGCQVPFLALRDSDARFQRAAGQNLRFMVKNMVKDGLVTTGPHAKEKADYVPCIQSTAARATAITHTLIYSSGVPLSRARTWILPTEEKGWVRFYKSVNVLLVRTSSLLCTLSGGRFHHAEEENSPPLPSGGTISHLWNDRFGTVQAASACLSEGVETEGAITQSAIGYLTPRIELEVANELFSNLFEPDAEISPSGTELIDDRFEVLVRGRLKSGSGKDSGLSYTIAYRFDGGRISKEITVEGPLGTSLRMMSRYRLRSIEPIVFGKGCDLVAAQLGVEVRHPAGASCLVIPSESAAIRSVSGKDVVWNPTPGLFALPIILEPAKQTAPFRMTYGIELKEWE